MLNFVGQDTQDESLDLGDSLVPRRPIGHGARYHGDLCDPAAILLLFDFNSHDRMSSQPRQIGKAALARAGRACEGFKKLTRLAHPAKQKMHRCGRAWKNEWIATALRASR